MRTVLVLVAACVLGIVLWLMRGSDDERSHVERSTHPPATARETPSITTSGSAAPITGRALIVKVHADKPLVAAEVRVDATSVLTDDDGIARMACPEPSTYNISARAPGFAMEARAVSIDPSAADVIVDIAMVSGAPLAGFVVDESNKRVAGAKVQVTRLAERDDEPTYVVADASGAWETEVAAGRYHLNARADGFGPTVAQPFEVDGKTARRDVVVRVTSGGAMFGKIVDADGKPVAGVKISAAQEARTESWYATSDAQGRYEMRGMPEGVYSVYRYTGRIGHQAGHVVIAHGQRSELDLVVDDDRIEGVVVDSKDKPLAGISISADDDEATTDVHGRFALVLAKESRAHWLFARRDKLALKPQKIEVEGGTKDLKIVLADESIVTGRVTFDGKPVTDYAVDLAPAKDEDLLFSTRGQTLHTADGRFTLRDVTAGPWRVMIAAEGCDVAFTEVKQIEPGKTIDVGVIALARGRRITGHVRDPAGAPVAGARVILNEEVSTWDSALQRRFEPRAETVSDASGGFVFDGISRRIQRDKPRIIARHDVHGLVSREITSDTVEIQFEPMGGIDGVIENFAGDETFFAAGAYSAPVNRAGEFRFDGLPPGRYQITESMESTHRRIKPVYVTVEAGRRTKVRVQLDMQTIELRVKVLSECAEVVRFRSEEPDSSGAAGEVLCERGSATLAYVPPGKYTACDWERRCASVVVAPSPLVQSIELRLEPPQRPQADAPP